MSSMFTGLLFMHGHITDLELVRRLAEDSAPAAKPPGKRERTSQRMAPAALACGDAGATFTRSGDVIVRVLRWATAR